jgi:hypothetical protein
MNGILDRREFAIGGAALFAGLLASEAMLTASPATETAGNTVKRAERQGFEPWVGLTLRWFSRPVHSATLPPLRIVFRNRFCEGSRS